MTISFALGALFLSTDMRWVIITPERTPCLQDLGPLVKRKPLRLNPGDRPTLRRHVSEADVSPLRQSDVDIFYRPSDLAIHPLDYLPDGLQEAS